MCPFYEQTFDDLYGAEMEVVLPKREFSGVNPGGGGPLRKIGYLLAVSGSHDIGYSSVGPEAKCLPK